MDQRDVRIKVTDMQGRLLWDKQYAIVTADVFTIPINFNGIKKGVYIIQVKAGKQTNVQKMVIQ